MIDDSLFFEFLDKGDKLSELGKYEDAIGCYDLALAINPNDCKIWNNRGIALAKLHRYREAAASFNRAVEIDLGYHEAWYNRGNALSHLGKLKKASECFARAIEIKPDRYKNEYLALPPPAG